MDIQVAVIGCGLMGNGIVHSLTLHGFRVIAVKHREEDNRFFDYLKYEMEKGRLTQAEYDNILSNVNYTTNLDEAAKCQLIIESINENSKDKQALFKNLETICAPETIFASNTSGIPIKQLSEATDRRDKVIGMHFMSPVSVMELVEIIKGTDTSDQTCEFVKHIVKAIEKTPIVVRDSPGFIASRLAASYVHEAIQMVEEQVASAESIDSIAKLGLGFPIGPLRLADAIGLDVTLDALENMRINLQEEKFAACSLLRQMVADGKLGKKSGVGFYSYKNNNN